MPTQTVCIRIWFFFLYKTAHTVVTQGSERGFGEREKQVPYPAPEAGDSLSDPW